MSRFAPLVVLASALLATTAVAAGASSPAPIGVETEQADGMTRIFVAVPDGSGVVRRHLVRETDAVVSAASSGRGPAGRALFTTWEENGRRFQSYSRDGGASWVQGRVVDTDLRLRAGRVGRGGAMPSAPAGYALPGDGRLFLVQFETTSLPEWRDALASLGVEVLSHVPHNAHIVRSIESDPVTIAALEFVERVEPYHPWYRLSEDLQTWIADDGDASRELRVRVMAFEWGPDAKQRIRAHAEATGARVAEYWPSGHVLELWADRDQLRAIAAHDDVLWIDRWTPPGSDMDLVRVESGTDWVEANLGYCGQGVRGEVMDGGTQLDHPDFDGIMSHGIVDNGSHGTSTYGIVFGNGDRDGDGEAQATGHLPCAEQGITSDYTNVTDRFAHTQELKNPPFLASFQSNSWGASQTTAYTSDSHEMDDIIWRLDIAILNSQSNTGNRTSRPQAWAKNVISVGAVKHYDTLDTSDDQWDGGASIGPAADDRIKPDVSYWYDDIYTTTTGSGYTPSFGGTSSSTPVSAGILGIMLQMWSENVWDTDPVGATVYDRQPHFSTLKGLLINNANQYPFAGSDADLSRYKQGWGRPNVQVAKERALNSLIVDEEVFLALDDTVTYDVDVLSGEEELKVTMVYPDPPGTTTSTLHRINDVNLKVSSPTGTIYHGNNGLVEGNESVAGGSPNSIDTVENVFVRNPEAGTWQVEITAFEINQDGYLGTPADDVTFALVVTGASGRYTEGEGKVRFWRDAYGCGQEISLQVKDGNVGTSSVSVQVWSDTETTPETVTLDEVSPGSGRYIGNIPSTGDTPSAGDGILSIAHADTITVEYIDVSDGQGGSNVPRQATAGADCFAPVVSAVQHDNVTGDTASITWATDEKATSLAYYGETVPPTGEAVGPGLTTAHRVNLSGLAECTVYHYSVSSTDLVGNVTENDNNGSYYHFETLGDFGYGLQPCHEGRISIDVGTVGCESSVPVTVGDQDLNLDDAAIDTVVIAVTSTTEPGSEFLTLTETGVDTATFTGAIATSGATPVADDGVLQVVGGDLLTATYIDEDDGTGSSATRYATATADCDGPQHTWVAVTSITNRDAVVNWTTDEATDGSVEWGLSPALGNSVPTVNTGTSHSLTIGPIEQCGRVYFRVHSTDEAGNTSFSDAEGSPYEFNGGTLGGIVQFDGFETNQGWTLEGDWEIDVPQGLGAAPGDPLTAAEGTQVLGQDLTGLGTSAGNYEINTDLSAISPVYDLSSLAGVELRFERWLNADSGANSYLDVKDAGGVWRNVWSAGGTNGTSWNEYVYDVSTHAAGNPSFQIRFRQTTRFAREAGWNVDSLVIRDGLQAEYGACGGCDGDPTFAGAVTATDDDPCAASGVTVSWTAAPAWGTGGSGTYAVYRDTSPGFTPSSGNLVASGVAGTSWTDLSAPTGATVYYLVRAENDESCGAGPNNGGLMDANTVYLSATNEAGQPAPGDVGNTLFVDPVAGAHARLSWLPAGNAAAYHVYRAPAPDAGFTRVGQPGDPLYEDEGALGDSQSWYYTVVAVDACGNESAD